MVASTQLLCNTPQQDYPLLSLASFSPSENYFSFSSSYWAFITCLSLGQVPMILPGRSPRGNESFEIVLPNIIISSSHTPEYRPAGIDWVRLKFIIQGGDPSCTPREENVFCFPASAAQGGHNWWGIGSWASDLCPPHPNQCGGSLSGA